jgi:hypothetical protein
MHAMKMAELICCQCLDSGTETIQWKWIKLHIFEASSAALFAK